MSDIRNLFPGTRIIWSTILPRLYFHDGKTNGAGPRCARNINKHAARIARGMSNTHVIYHTNMFPVSSKHLFRHDGLHLTNEGLRVFRLHLEEAIVFFDANPDELKYPLI